MSLESDVDYLVLVSLNVMLRLGSALNRPPVFPKLNQSVINNATKVSSRTPKRLIYYSNGQDKSMKTGIFPVFMLIRQLVSQVINKIKNILGGQQFIS